MDNNISVQLLLVLVIVAAVNSANQCPPECRCTRRVTRCVLKDLTEVPANIPISTHVLDLRFNRLTDLRRDTFKRLPFLDTLILNDNRLRKIDDGAFSGLANLRHLYLYNNALTEVTDGTFDGLRDLHVLNLNNNRLQNLERGSLSQVPELKRLYLNGNQLTSLRVSLIQPLANLQRLRLNANPLHCDCVMDNLAIFLKNNPVIDVQKGLNCATPAELKGYDIFTANIRCKPVRLIEEPVSQSIGFGSEARFRCRSDSTDGSVDIEWLHNSTAIHGPSFKYRLVDGGQTLMVRNTTADDEGYYECVARGHGETVRTKPALLRHRRQAVPHEGVFPSRLHPPILTVKPGDVKAREGSTVRLHCEAVGHPTPRIGWYRHGRPIDVNQRFQLNHRGTVLTIGPINSDVTGEYTCEAINEFGRVMSVSRVRMTRSSPPRITEPPTDLTVAVNGRAQFRCVAQGHPPPHYVWHFNGSPIPTTRGHYFISNDETVLELARATERDAGWYMCQAGNAVGSSTAQVQLKVVDADTLLQPPTAAVPNIRPPPPTRSNNSLRPPPPSTPRRRRPNAGASRGNQRGRRPQQPPPPLLPTSIGGVGSPQTATDDQRRRQQLEAAVIDGSGRPTASPHVERVVTTQLIRDRVRLATENVDRAINSTRQGLYDGRSKSPSEILALFRFPGPQAIELARAREIYEETLTLIQIDVERGIMVNATRDPSISQESLLSVSHLQMIMELSGCSPRQFKDPCNDMCFHLKYRSYDGQCNNLNQPMWGVSLMPFQRLLAPIYENGFNAPVGWLPDKLYNGHRKPNSRSVSIRVVSTSRVTKDTDYSSMLMQWGQFVDHDLDFTAAAASRHIFSSGAFCNRTCDNIAPCFNIPMPLEDPRRASQNQQLPACIEFERSSAACGSGETSVIFKTVTYREQLNTITSFIDGSQIYGSSEQEALDLRDLFSDHGQLRYDIVSHAQKPYLPFNRDSPMDCRRNHSENHPIRCFMAGDFRANEQLGLLTMHTVWLREHNRIAAKLLQINPHWDGETIYHETRKIVGAQLQHITYQHWLPKILGEAAMRDRVGDYSGYRSSVNPTVSNVFATAAFRFGHSLINPFLHRYDADFRPIAQGHLPLHLAFFAPERLLSEGGVDPILRGLFASAAKQPKSNEMLNKELTEKLFSRAHQVALDLAALNIQRGRDHALPGYLEWRRYCNLSAPDSWEQLGSVIEDSHVRTKLRQLYGHPANLDLWVGGLAEDLLEGARVGPTFACIIGEQFRRSRDGDRFWYESALTFSQLQLDEIRRASLASVLCDNGDAIDRLPTDVFVHHADRQKAYRSCDAIPRINLNLWQTCCQADGCGRFESDDGVDDINELVETLPNARVPDTPQHHHQPTGNSVREPRLQNLVQAGAEERMLHRLDELEKTVQQLQTRVESLTGLQSINTVVESTCSDLQGETRTEGERWIIDRCTRCSCKKGQIWCTEEKCAKLSCRRRIRLPSQCCQICDDRRV